MFMKHYAPNRCLYIKVAKLRTGVDVNEELKFFVKIQKKKNWGGGGVWGGGRVGGGSGLM